MSDVLRAVSKLQSILYLQFYYIRRQASSFECNVKYELDECLMILQDVVALLVSNTDYSSESLAINKNPNEQCRSSQVLLSRYHLSNIS